MSRCPDWTALAAARAAAPLADPPGFAEARLHLADCADCRRAAVAADPLFLFAGLAPAGGAGTPRGAADSEMQGAVLALVRASRVASGGREPAGRTPASRRLRYAAGFVIASLLAFSGASRAPVGVAAAPPAPEALAGPVETAEAGIASTVEELDRPEARVYELSNADLAVVMIVDPGLDV